MRTSRSQQCRFCPPSFGEAKGRRQLTRTFRSQQCRFWPPPFGAAKGRVGEG